MSYFDKPKKKHVIIMRANNGYIVTLGYDMGREDRDTYVATEQDLPAVVKEAIEIEKATHDASLVKWEEKEQKTADGYEWAKKKEEKKDKTDKGEKDKTNKSE